jgi:hypothetical protein
MRKRRTSRRRGRRRRRRRRREERQRAGAYRRTPHAHQSQLLPYDSGAAVAWSRLFVIIISGHMYSGVPMNEFLIKVSVKIMESVIFAKKTSLSRGQ